MRRRSRKARDSRSQRQACPCGSGRAYSECCGPLHLGQQRAASAEALMRSRYSAFVAGDVDYLLRTWHPDTRPDELDLDTDREWIGLEVLATTGGSAFHTEGTVAFRAHFRDADGPGDQSEVSSFVRLGGSWVYTSGRPG
jgi:SEC-C motif domain protein